MSVLGRLQLLLRSCQRLFVFSNALFLQNKFFPEQRQLRRQPFCAFIEIFDSRRSQLKTALRHLHLLADGHQSRFAFFDCFASRIPAGFCQSQGFVALVDLRLRYLYGGVRLVQLNRRGCHCIRSVLSGFFQRRILTGDLFDLFDRVPVLNLQCVQIGAGGNGCRVGFTERSGELLDLLRCQSDLFFQGLLCFLCILKPLGILTLSVIAFLQFGICGVQRALILRYYCFLKRQLPFQRTQV